MNSEKWIFRKGEEYYLEICAANASADVYVNGTKLVHHDGGYSAFRVNMTDQIQEEKPGSSCCG